METMRLALMGLGSFAAVAVLGGLLGAAYVVIGAVWAALGEGDVRGDAERDGAAHGGHAAGKMENR